MSSDLRKLIEGLRLLVATSGAETLDVAALLDKRERDRKLGEDGAGTPGVTTTANVGAFMVPLGGRISRPDPNGPAEIVPGYLLRAPDITGKKIRRRKKVSSSSE